MGVIKRININRIEGSMNTAIEMSSKISFLQEELVHIKSQMENNCRFLKSGIISDQAFNGNERNFEKRRKQIVKEINDDVKILLKLSEETKKDLKLNKL